MGFHNWIQCVSGQHDLLSPGTHKLYLAGSSGRLLHLCRFYLQERQGNVDYKGYLLPRR